MLQSTSECHLVDDTRDVGCAPQRFDERWRAVIVQLEERSCGMPAALTRLSPCAVEQLDVDNVRLRVDSLTYATHYPDG